MWLYEIFGFFFNITWLPALFLILGFAFLIFELINPGFGAPGISGIFLLLLGVIITARSFTEAIVMVILLLILIGLLVFLVFRAVSKGKLSKRLVLSDSLNKESGYSGRKDYTSFLGKTGIAFTTLRPTGIAEFDGKKLDVVTEGEYITNGSNIEVIKVEGMRIVVRELVDTN